MDFSAKSNRQFSTHGWCYFTPAGFDTCSLMGESETLIDTFSPSLTISPREEENRRAASSHQLAEEAENNSMAKSQSPVKHLGKYFIVWQLVITRPLSLCLLSSHGSLSSSFYSTTSFLSRALKKHPALVGKPWRGSGKAGNSVQGWR